MKKKECLFVLSQNELLKVEGGGSFLPIVTGPSAIVTWAAKKFAGVFVH